ncbi:MAG: hypothetical protein QOF33_2282, partial [Thermomicrobiales bacterium]|nr:hypothetical protein [Thermomicrobiales bacterium]
MQRAESVVTTAFCIPRSACLVLSSGGSGVFFGPAAFRGLCTGRPLAGAPFRTDPVPVTAYRWSDYGNPARLSINAAAGDRDGLLHV